MRNAICVRTQTSKVPTQDILLVSSLFCALGATADVAIYGHPEGIADVLTARPFKNSVELQHCASNVYDQFCRK